MLSYNYTSYISLFTPIFIKDEPDLICIQLILQVSYVILISFSSDKSEHYDKLTNGIFHRKTKYVMRSKISRLALLRHQIN